MLVKRFLVVLGAAGLCLPGCGGDESSGGLISSAYASMAHVSGEAKVSECPNGGVELEAGIDSNGNK